MNKADEKAAIQAAESAVLAYQDYEHSGALERQAADIDRLQSALRGLLVLLVEKNVITIDEIGNKVY